MQDANTRTKIISILGGSRGKSVCLGADCCQHFDLTRKKNPDSMNNFFFFFKHANIFHILAGEVKGEPGWKFGEAQ